ncbi:MAG TPA: UDP-3-O-acyl-N-acetylglucosamine deacetylase [Aliiroseovarius sp.]|nr:UDP-3-O-acyl-N-acetylglucosamine deacetylase [Aliiroseovarius sp.]
MQNTVSSPVLFTGTGLHSGAPAQLRILPASAEYGIWFRRTDLGAREGLIAARWDNVTESRLCTLVGNEHGASVSTIEHLMAALAGCGIHNALIEIDGPEVPILDGSASDFVSAILRAGIQRQSAPVRVVEILKPVEVRAGEAWARLEPAKGFEISFHIDFADAAIGRQERVLNMANGAFVRELSASRTFCRLDDVNAMQANGLALGGTFDNAVVVDGAKILSPGGLRHADEPVRHKMLDALGDLALAGAPILGRYHGHRAGHALTNCLLRQLFATPGATRLKVCDGDMVNHLPGVGISRADLPLSA